MVALSNSTITKTQPDIINRFISSLDVKPKSRETYRAAIKQYFAFIETREITQPTRTDILEYKRSLLERKHSACTVSSYMTAVKMFYVFLEAEKIYPNIAAGIKGAKAPEGFRKDALTLQQAKSVLRIDTETLEGKRNYAIVNLLLNTGLRTIEAQRANIEDIRQQGGEALLYIQGKGRDSKDNFVLLTETVHQPIIDYINARGKVEPSAPLFSSQSDRNQGGRLSTHSISRIAKQALKNAGLDNERLTAHSFRHTAITLSLINGASLTEAQAMARHKNINTTLIYSHALNRIAQAPERRIAALFAQ